MNSPGTPIRLLIADDHAMVRAGIRSLLEDAGGIEVLGEAGRGDEALALLAKMKDRPPHILLLDVSMPGPDALDVLRKIKTEHPAVRCVMLSIYGEDQYGLRAMRAGAWGYLSKERGGKDLVEAVRNVHAGKTWVSEALAERLRTDVSAEKVAQGHAQLSSREFDVLWLLGGGQSVKEIAERFRLSPKTVSTFRSRILKKLAFKGDADIVRYVSSLVAGGGKPPERLTTPPAPSASGGGAPAAGTPPKRA
jgi:DNA-binding NarL/FixJ family response regulator